MDKTYKIKYSLGNDPIKNKITFNSFLKSVWELSNTNLHYVDFVAVFGNDLKAIFKPYRIKK